MRQRKVHPYTYGSNAAQRNLKRETMLYKQQVQIKRRHSWYGPDPRYIRGAAGIPVLQSIYGRYMLWSIREQKSRVVLYPGGA